MKKLLLAGALALATTMSHAQVFLPQDDLPRPVPSLATLIDVIAFHHLARSLCGYTNQSEIIVRAMVDAMINYDLNSEEILTLATQRIISIQTQVIYTKSQKTFCKRLPVGEPS